MPPSHGAPAGTRTSPRAARERALPVLFYGALLVVVLGILSGLLDDVLPDGLARRVGFNSEGLVLALLLASFVQYARPRLLLCGRGWAITGALGAGCLALGLVLLASDLPSRFKTLNETFVVAGVMLPYLYPGRRPSRAVALGLSAAVLVVVVSASSDELVTGFAESLGVLLLVPVAFDVVDRGILDSSVTTRPALRYCWYGLLVLVPLTWSTLFHQAPLTGTAYDVVRYAVRMHEAFVCVLLVSLFLAVGLGRTGRRAHHG